MKRLTLLLIGTLFLGACGDDNEPRIPEFDGRWTGSVSGAQVIVLANENDGDISGSGTFRVGTESLAFTIDGVHNHPDISFTIGAAGAEDANFDGEFTNDETIRGSLRGSGFSGETLVLIKD